MSRLVHADGIAMPRLNRRRAKPLPGSGQQHTATGHTPQASGVPSAPKRVAQLRRMGHTTQITPSVPALRAAFATVKHLASEYPAPCQMGPFVLSLASRGASRRCDLIRAGLEPLVGEWLERNGYEVERIGRQLPELPEPVFTSTDGHVDPAVLVYFMERDRGLIRLGPDVSLARMLRAVAVAWPGMGVVVAGTRVDQLYRLRKAIGFPRGHCTVHHGRSDRAVRAGPLALATYSILGSGGIDLRDCQLLILLDPLEMLSSKWNKDILRMAGHARLFGFVACRDEFNLLENDRLLGLFGSGAIEVPRHGRIMRPRQVLTMRVEGGPQFAKDLSLIDLLQRSVWRHPVRNRRLVRLVQGLANGDRQAVGALLGENDDLPDQGKIVVLASSLDHAAHLARLLPGWRLDLGQPLDRTGLSAAKLAIVSSHSQRRPRDDRRLIVTPGGLDRVQWLDVLVRADTGIGVPTMKWADARQGSLRARTAATVIDVDDRHHPLLRRLSAQRRQAYLEAGWRLPQIYLTELDQFLAQRPAPLTSSR